MDPLTSSLLLTSFSLTQLKDFSGCEGWGTHFFLSGTSLLGKGSGGRGRPILKQGGAPGGVGGPPGGRGGGGGGGQQVNGRGGGGGGRSLVVIEEDKVSGPPGGGGEDTGPVCGETETSKRQNINKDAFRVPQHCAFPYSYSPPGLDPEACSHLPHTIKPRSLPLHPEHPTHRYTHKANTDIVDSHSHHMQQRD